MLIVTAAGANSYQWRFNGSDIAGATNASLTITNAQLTNSGYYVAVAKNALGWVPAIPAYLSVVDTPGLVPFSNRFYSNAIAVYQDNDGSGPVSNGTATIIAGPVLDYMQPVPGVSLAVRNGFFGARTSSVPSVAAGQTTYYRISVSYSNPHPGTNISTVLKLTAGGGAYPVPTATNFYFPPWLEWPDADPEFFDYTYPVGNATRPNLLLVPGETLHVTNFLFGYSDLGVPLCQWRKDGKEIGAPFYFTNFSENVSFIIPNVQASDAGIYDLEYLGNNWVIGPHTVLSIQITNGQGVLQSPRMAGTNFVFDLLSPPRRQYLIQRSTNLLSWTDLQTVTNSDQNSTATTTISNGAVGAAAFYRGKLLP